MHGEVWEVLLWEQHLKLGEASDSHKGSEHCGDNRQTNNTPREKAFFQLLIIRKWFPGSVETQRTSVRSATGAQAVAHMLLVCSQRLVAWIDPSLSVTGSSASVRSRLKRDQWLERTLVLCGRVRPDLSWVLCASRVFSRLAWVWDLLVKGHETLLLLKVYIASHALTRQIFHSYLLLVYCTLGLQVWGVKTGPVLEVLLLSQGKIYKVDNERARSQVPWKTMGSPFVCHCGYQVLKWVPSTPERWQENPDWILLGKMPQRRFLKGEIWVWTRYKIIR